MQTLSNYLYFNRTCSICKCYYKNKIKLIEWKNIGDSYTINLEWQIGNSVASNLLPQDVKY